MVKGVDSRQLKKAFSQLLTLTQQKEQQGGPMLPGLVRGQGPTGGPLLVDLDVEAGGGGEAAEGLDSTSGRSSRCVLGR